jgi:kinesin family protein 5
MSNVTVIPRFRPLNNREKSEANGGNVVVEFEDDHTFTINDAGKPHRFTFDRVFPPTCRQVEMFEFVGIPILKDVFQGYNATIFAYGQTGSGKTHSMMGNIHDDEHKGIIPRIVEAVFAGIEQSESTINFTVKVSYVEIYNEKIRDLMDKKKDNLKVRESPTGVWIEDVTQTYVTSTEDVYRVMTIGGDHRAKSATLMNAESSRSHSVFIITVGQEDTTTGTKRGAKLTLVDLAGSEKIAKTGAEGSTLVEAQNINKSLSALGNVINALTTAPPAGKGGAAGHKHIPYRDSKLTYLLSDSLGGNSKTCLIITGSPSQFNVDETLSTIRFGNRAKNIKNKPKQNQERSAAEYQRLLNTANAKISAQEAVLRALEAEVTAYRRCLCKGDPAALPAPLVAMYMAAVARVARDNKGHPDWSKYLLSDEEERKAAAAAAATANLLAGGEVSEADAAGAAALAALTTPSVLSPSQSSPTDGEGDTADVDADPDADAGEGGDEGDEGADSVGPLDGSSGLRRGSKRTTDGGADRRTSSLTLAKNTRDLLSANDELESELDAARRDVEEARRELAEAQQQAEQQVRTADEKIAQLTAAVAEATEQKDDAERRVKEEEERAKLSEQKRALLDHERANELEEARRDGEETRARVLALKASLAEAEAERASLDDACAAATARASKAERLIQRLKDRNGAEWVDEVAKEMEADSQQQQQGVGGGSDGDAAAEGEGKTSSGGSSAGMKLTPSQAAATIRQLRDQNTAFKTALHRKCEQYVNAQTALLAYKEHMDTLEASLDDAQRSSAVQAAAHATAAHALQEKLEATEMMCQKLLQSGRYWRSQGVYSRFTKGAGIGNSGSGSGGRIVVPLHGSGAAGSGVGGSPAKGGVIVVPGSAGEAGAVAGAAVAASTATTVGGVSHGNVTKPTTVSGKGRGLGVFF